MTKSVDTHECKGCKHVEYGDGFCYMFETKPVTLPCGQHDKFAKQRTENGRKFLERIANGY